MTFAEIAASLGITKYPELLDEIYEEVKNGAQPPFDRALVDRHHEERQLFGDYYDAVVAGLEDLQKKPEALAYATVGAHYLLRVGQKDAKKFTVPEPDGSPALDMLPLFVLLPMADVGLGEFEKRGVSREDAESYMRVFRSDLGVNVRRHGRPGVDQLYFNWTTLYIYALIFPCGGFKFNLTTNGRFFYVLRHNATGQVAVLLHDRDIHRSGEILGSAGLEDAEGSFHIEVVETDTHWIGHMADENGLMERQPREFSKEEWSLAVAPGDCVLAIHIPAGQGLEQTATRQAIADAFAYARKYYSDYSPKALHCGSWLLNPELKQILGDNSNIVAFASLFHLHPTKCAGQGVFNFVFRSAVNPDIASLPEDTRLQRALKAKFLAGGYHRNFGGFILPPA